MKIIILITLLPIFMASSNKCHAPAPSPSPVVQETPLLSTAL